jgi:hypothetical protein
VAQRLKRGTLKYLKFTSIMARFRMRPLRRPGGRALYGGVLRFAGGVHAWP